MEKMILTDACRFKSCFYMNKKGDLCGRTKENPILTRLRQSSNLQTKNNQITEKTRWLYLLFNKQETIQLNWIKLTGECANVVNIPSNHYGFRHQTSSSTRDASQSIRLQSWY